MTPQQFHALLERYPVVRARDFCANDASTCPVPRRAVTASAVAADVNQRVGGLAAAASATPGSAAAPLAALATPTLEFWACFNSLLASAAPGDKAAQRAAMSAFENLHFSLIKDSSLEEAEEALIAVEATMSAAHAPGAPLPPR